MRPLLPSALGVGYLVADKGETKALPLVWTDWAGFEAAGKANADAADAMATAAGSGSLEALTAAFGATGKTCGACHEKFRAKYGLPFDLLSDEGNAFARIQDGAPLASYGRLGPSDAARYVRAQMARDKRRGRALVGQAALEEARHLVGRRTAVGLVGVEAKAGS